MEKFKNVESRPVPLNSAHVDTDQIIQKQFLKGLKELALDNSYFLIGDLMMMVPQTKNLF